MAEIASPARGLAFEVSVDPDCRIDEASAVNDDGLPTVSQRRLTRRTCRVDDDTLEAIGEGVAALRCDQR